MGVKLDRKSSNCPREFSEVISPALGLVLTLSPVPKTIQSYSSSMVKSLIWRKPEAGRTNWTTNQLVWKDCSSTEEITSLLRLPRNCSPRFKAEAGHEIPLPGPSWVSYTLGWGRDRGKCLRFTRPDCALKNKNAEKLPPRMPKKLLRSCQKSKSWRCYQNTRIILYSSIFVLLNDRPAKETTHNTMQIAEARISSYAWSINHSSCNCQQFFKRICKKKILADRSPRSPVDWELVVGAFFMTRSRSFHFTATMMQRGLTHVKTGKLHESHEPFVFWSRKSLKCEAFSWFIACLQPCGISIKPQQFLASWKWEKSANTRVSHFS